MRLSFSDDRILAVVAHPDDAELLCAGTLARAIADGAAAAICVLCQGDKGQTTPPTADLAQVRRQEMAAAASVLGTELYHGVTCDSELVDSPANRNWLCAVMRVFCPTLVLAHHPDDYHSDHRAASAIADAATWTCASAGYHIDDAKDTVPLDSPPALWWMDTIGMHGSAPTILIDVSDHADTKRAMLTSHVTQLARAADSGFAPLEELMELQMSARGMQGGVAAAEAFTPRNSFKRMSAF